MPGYSGKVHNQQLNVAKKANEGRLGQTGGKTGGVPQ